MGCPKRNPSTDVGSGAVQKKQNAVLRETIAQLNTRFGSGTTDADQLSYLNTLTEKTLESAIPRK